MGLAVPHLRIREAFQAELMRSLPFAGSRDHIAARREIGESERLFPRANAKHRKRTGCAAVDRAIRRPVVERSA